MNNKALPATLLCDFYKVCHLRLYPTGTEFIYSTFTPRTSKYGDNVEAVVVFGLQGFVKKYLMDYFNENFFGRPEEDVVNEYVRVLKFTLGEENPDATHLRELHQLGYLPIQIKALKEGLLAPIKVPVLTIENTHPKFFWLTNYLETILSTQLWQGITSATKAHRFKGLLDKYALETVGHTEDVKFAGHDFSMRGMSSLETSYLSGAGHLLSFVGTDTIPAILYLEEYYKANIEKELVGCSVKATEHSIQSAYGRDELNAFTQIIDKTPTGILSIVSDTYDFWNNIEETLPALKDKIMDRDGKIVIRPDSGIPQDILCGKDIPDLSNVSYIETLEDAKDNFYDQLLEQLREETPHGEHGDTEVYGEFKFKGKYYEMEIEVEYNRYDKQYYYIDGDKLVKFEEFTPKSSDLGLIESLWNTFGGTVSEQGYKVLDSHIGSIYGDSITYDSAQEICERLKEKGFASTNVVFGLGSYFFQMNTRDTYGFAMKATHAVINGEERLLFKDPKTDSGMKKSQKGRVVVQMTPDGIWYRDGLNLTQQYELSHLDLLETVFSNGQLVREQSLKEIRELLAAQL